MSYVLYTTAANKRFFIKNTYKNAAGQPFALSNNYTAEDTTVYQIFFSNVDGWWVTLGETFIATDQRTFIAT